MDTRKNPDRKSSTKDDPSVSICVRFPGELRTRIPLNWRASFTLVELLVAIAIVGVLAGLTLIALSGAQRDAEISRTRATIRKINEVILSKWEEYTTRSIPLAIPSAATTPDSATGEIPLTARNAARTKIIALRDLMRLEMPDRYGDLEWSPTIVLCRITGESSLVDVGSVPFPADWSNYRRRFGFNFPTGRLSQSLPPAAWKRDGLTPTIAKINQLFFSNGSSPISLYEYEYAIFDSAELLYQIVSCSHSESGDGLAHFRSSEIGDTNENGYPEFIDAWGRPIAWIRWPAGARSWSEIVRSAYLDVNDPNIQNTDSLDPTKADWRYGETLPTPVGDKPYTLQPLIVSAGADGFYNTYFGDTRFAFATQQPYSLFPYYYADPYGLNFGARLQDVYPLSFNPEPDITSHDSETEL